MRATDKFYGPISCNVLHFCILPVHDSNSEHQHRVYLMSGKITHRHTERILRYVDRDVKLNTRGPMVL